MRGNGEMFPLNGPAWSLFFEYIGNFLYALFLRRLSDKALERNGAVLQNDIQLSMRSVIASVGGDVSDWLKMFGVSTGASLASVEDDIIKSIAFGKVYKEKWYLSKAIWSDVKSKQSDIQTVIAKGVAGNKSVYDIAKDLEKYVNPAAKKEA